MTDSSTDSPNSPDDLRVRIGKIEDYSKHFLADQLEEVLGQQEEDQERIADLEAEVASMKETIQTLAGPNSNRSPPEKRADDLRMAMVRAAKEDDLKEVRWWKDEVKNALIAQNHTGLNKPDYYDAMERAAEHDGFGMSTKPVTKDGRTWEAKSVKVVLDDVPGNGGSRDSTTPPPEGNGHERHDNQTAADSNTI